MRISEENPFINNNRNDNPEGHDRLNKPGPHPDHPGRPDHPEKPDKPGHPEKPDHPEKPELPVTIIVNGAEKILPAGTRQLSYADVVRLSEGSYEDSDRTIYTITYSSGPAQNRSGQLVKGDVVFVRKGMIFVVGCSDKS